MRDTCSIGNLTEGMVLTALLRTGRRLLLPFGDGHHPYDLAYDDGGVLRRVQCKTGRLFRDGSSVHFTVVKYTGNKGHRIYDDDDIDYFGVYCPDTDAVYMVPKAEVGQGTTFVLRLEPTKNGRTKGIHWASDYQLIESEEVALGGDQGEAALGVVV
jgi:hypothetical protein